MPDTLEPDSFPDASVRRKVYGAPRVVATLPPFVVCQLAPESTTTSGILDFDTTRNSWSTGGKVNGEYHTTRSVDTYFCLCRWFMSSMSFTSRLRRRLKSSDLGRSDNLIDFTYPRTTAFFPPFSKGRKKITRNIRKNRKEYRESAMKRIKNIKRNQGNATKSWEKNKGVNSSFTRATNARSSAKKRFVVFACRRFTYPRQLVFVCTHTVAMFDISR